MEIFIGLCVVAGALYMGLGEIALAIRHRTMNVNVKLPTINVRTDQPSEGPRHEQEKP